ncbi:MAG TPA: TolC family protein [Terriglobia bacterium]|nr:TolC family protein [Terriglobia bacterium]
MTYKNLTALVLLLIAASTPAAADSTPQPMTLAQCVETALEHHPDLAAALAMIDEAQAQLKIAHSAFLPQINLGSFYTRQTFNYSGQPGTPPDLWQRFYQGESNSTSPYYYGGINLSQDIFDFGRKRGTIDRSMAELRAAGHNYQNVKNQIYYNVRAAYYTELADRELVNVEQQGLDNAAQHLQQAEAFYQVGRDPKINVTQEQVAVANAKLALEQAQANLDVAHAGLATAMGIPIEQAPEPVDTLAQIEPAGTLDELLVQAVEKRPDLQSLREQVTAAQADVEYAHANLKPALNLSMFYNFNNLQFPLIYNWSLAGLFAQSLFSGGERHAALRQSEAERRVSQAQHASLFLRVRQGVYSAYSNVRVAQDQINTALTAASEAKENLQLAEGRYQVGYGNIIELTDAQLLATRTATQVVTTRFSYQSASAQLDFVVGKGPQ